MSQDPAAALDAGRETEPVSNPLLTGGNASPLPQPATWLERHLVNAAFDYLGFPPLTVVLWDGQEIRPEGVVPRWRLKLNKRYALLRLCLNPSLELGELYSEGALEIEGDLLSFLEMLYRALEGCSSRRSYLRYLWRDPAPRPASRTKARHHVQYHYDLGNDFYSLWLDRATMQYTCAYYPREPMGLAEAQTAKMRYICAKLRLKPGESVVEAGCGWGGLALFMARHYGVRVTAYNISREQLSYARDQLAHTDLSDRVDFVEDDYRDIRGRYDVFVSVGMLEHVGPRHYQGLGEVLDRCLTARGRGLIHSIGRNKPGRTNAWVEERIFPGSYPPTLREIMGVLELPGLSVLDVENLRLHYTQTLGAWLRRYEAHAEVVRRRYGVGFERAWRLYLSGSLASFSTGWLQLFQVLFARPGVNDLPRSRAHLYRDPESETPIE